MVMFNADNLCSESEKMWWNSDKSFPKLKNKHNKKYQKVKEKEFNLFIDRLIYHIKLFPADKKEQQVWKKDALKILDEYTQKSDLITQADTRLLFHGFPEATKGFLDSAKKFNPNITTENLVQAIRNVWIMNIIQVLLNLKVEYSPSMFAYSMLYPYTDNYLDDNNLSKEAKLKINLRFKKRLENQQILPDNDYENNLFKLVSIIENQYSRSEYKELFESLMYIHKSQEASLYQQNITACPYEENILGISINKGGSSVLADAYLVNGTLNETQITFFFNYGVMLQFCDDLQDSLEDYKNGHMTIYSQIAHKWPLDSLANALFSYIESTLNCIDSMCASDMECTKNLISKNCILLVLQAIIKNKGLFSGSYIKRINDYLPFTPSYTANLYNMLKKKYSSLEPGYNNLSVEEIIFFMLEE